MWTTPWVMKYARINFLSISFRQQGQLLTVLLTPVEPGAVTASQINDCVGRWFERVREAASRRIGTAPRASDTALVSVSAEPAYNRKALPLLIGCLLVGFGTWVLQEDTVRRPIWLVAVAVAVLFFLGIIWFGLTFLRANHALWHGDLDAVTSDDPPAPEPAGVGGAGTSPAGSPAARFERPFWWTASAWIFVATGLFSVVDALASLYSRPMNLALSPGVAYLFAGIALLTRSRRWRLVALVTLALAVAAGTCIAVMLAISPQHGRLDVPALGLDVPATLEPRWAAAGVVFLALVLFWPCYMLLSARGRRLFARAANGTSGASAQSLVGSGAGTGLSPRARARWARTSFTVVCLASLAIVLLLGWLSYRNRYVPASLGGAAGGAAAADGAFTPASENQFVLYSMPPSGKYPSGAMPWELKFLVPAHHFARVLFIRWTNGVPNVEKGLGAYFEVAKPSLAGTLLLWCERPAQAAASRSTNEVQWSVNLVGHDASGSLLRGEPAYRRLQPPPRLTVRSGHQAILRLVDYVTPDGGASNGQSGVELRVFLEPLKFPPTRTDPLEFEGTNYVAGYGPGWTADDALKAIKEWPVDQ
jgi:hypothetical protein